MTTFNDFAQWLFPGERIPNRRRNPDIPREVRPLLEEVSQCTQIPMDWIERTAGLVVDGLAGLRCLWFLHGLRGEVQAEGQNRPVDNRLADELESIRIRESRYNESTGANVHVTIDWSGGVAVEGMYKAGSTKTRTTKLGKWLKKHGASAELLHAFETRDMPMWHWEISCHPYDILTMSHMRPWTSCMRPGGEYEYGPLTDLAAGSAVIFFYRLGAPKPCGRRILRPAVFESLKPFIADGGRTYGCGPQAMPADQIQTILREASGLDVAVRAAPICGNGHTGQMLTRNIYSDTDHHGCDQSDEDYERSYDNLANGRWPEPKLDMGKLRSIAEEFKGQIEFDDEEFDPQEYEWDIEQLQADAWQYIDALIIEHDNFERAIHMLEEPAALAEEVGTALSSNEGIEELDEYLWDDIYSYVRESLKEYLNEIVSREPLDVYLVSEDVVGYDAPRTAARKEFQEHEYDSSIKKFSVSSMLRGALGDFEDWVHRMLVRHGVDDGDYMNHRVVMIPRAFRRLFKALPSAADVHVEFDLRSGEQWF